MTTLYPMHRLREARLYRVSRWRQLGSGLLPVLLLGCSAMPMSPGVAQAEESRNRADGDLMYEVMIAELAGRRGYLDLATAGYLRAAQLTTDARVAERATKLAIWGRQWNDAESAAHRWQELDDTSIEAHELLAQVYLRVQKPADAAAEFAHVIDASDSTDTAIRDVNILLLGENNAALALTTMQALHSRYPSNIEAQLGLARLSLAQNSGKAALAAVNKALLTDASNTDALLLKAQVLAAMGNPSDGFTELSTALEIDSENVDLRLGYARLLVDAGRYKEASEQLDILFEQSPDNADALLTIGLLALDSKRIDAAKQYLTRLLTIEKRPNQANYYLGRIADQQREIELAISYYEHVEQSDQAKAAELYLPARIRAAELHATAGNLAIARSRLQSLQTSVHDPAIQPQLITAEGRILQQAGQASEAVEVLTDGLAQFPDNGRLLYARALAAERSGDNTMLREDLGRLIETEPDNAHALNALGYFLADENTQLDDAERHLEKAALLEPNDPAIMDSLGWLRFRQGDLVNAQLLLEKAYSMLPDGEIAAHLGEVLWVKGEQSAARTLWDKALLESPDDDTLKGVVRRLAE